MSEFKGTPGPWTYADRAPISVGSAWVSSDEVHKIAVCDGSRNGPHGFCYVMNDGENEANARLIAAAPEMFALVNRVAELNPDAGEIGAGMLIQLVTEARAARTKATQP